jgi:hypothetical protein
MNSESWNPGQPDSSEVTHEFFMTAAHGDESLTSWNDPGPALEPAPPTLAPTK